MTSHRDGPSPEHAGGRLTPADVHHVLFTRAGLGRRGYDEVEVDVFLERVEQELARLIHERDDLGNELARLRSQRGSGGAAAGADTPLAHEDAQLEAVRLLAAAQRTAEVYVADAARYSEQMVREAREQSEQMVAEARRAALRAVETTQPLTGEGVVPASGAALAPVATAEQIEQQVLHLKALGQLVRVQLQTYLEALLRDVQEEWERATPGPAAAPPGSDPTPADAEPIVAEDAPGVPDEPEAEPPPGVRDEPAAEDARGASDEPAAEDAPGASDEPAAEGIPDAPGEAEAEGAEAEGAAPAAQDPAREAPDAPAEKPDRPDGSAKPRPRKRTTVKLHTR